MSSPGVVRIEPADPAVSEFLRSTPSTTYCHHPEWPGIIRDALGHEGWFWADRAASGEITAVMPVCHVRSRLLGDHLVSLPFLNAGGAVGNERGRERLMAYALEVADDLGCAAEIRSREAPPDGFAPTVRRITVVKDLPDSSEEAWKNSIKSKVRSQIRRPQKEGLEFRTGADELDSFYRVFAQNMRDLGTPVITRRFFELIGARLAESVVFGAVYRNGAAVAGGCGFVWNGEFEITWASSLKDHNRVAPNMLLYWGLMEHVIEARSVRLFDFGRCRPDSGTHRFKQQWGTRDIPLPWVSSSPGEPGEGRALRIASQMWTRMPLPIANRLGPHLARLLP